MTIQINLRMTEDFLKQAKEYAKNHGFLNIQEFFREAAREKIYDEMEIRPEYIEVLKSKKANTFLSVEESKKYMEELRKKAGLK